MQVALEVRDVRTPKHGGGDPRRIGERRSLGGVPWTLKAEDEVGPAFTSLFHDSLRAARFEVLKRAPVKVHVDVTIFHMYGYMGYKIETAFNVRVSRGNAVVFDRDLTRNHGFYYKNNKALRRAFHEVMNLIAKDAVALFRSPDFAAAVRTPEHAHQVEPPTRRTGVRS